MPDALPRSTTIRLDLDVIRSFIAALTGSPDTPVHWQVFDDTPARDQSLARCWFGPVDIRALTDHQLAGCGVFIAVNETDGQHRRADSITRVRACFCDVDGAPITPVLPASFATITARGENPFWLATGPVDEFSYVQSRLARFYGTDRSVKDPSRVMRVPGTWHLKAEPRLVGFRPGSGANTGSGASYTFQQILDAHPVDDPPPPDFKKFRLVRPSKAWVETRSKLVRQRASGRSWAEGGRHMALLETLTHARKFHLPDDHVRSIAYEYGSTAGLPDREIEKVYEWVMVSVTPNPDDDPALRTAPVAVPDPLPDSSPDASPDSLPDPIATVYAEIAALESPTLREQRIKETSKKFDISVSTIKAEVSALRKSSEGPNLVTQNFHIDLSGLPWFGSWKGVFGAKSVPGGWSIDENAIVCTRPLWPAALGQEVSTGEDYVMLRWVDQYGETRERWYSQISLRDRDTIRSIPGACVGASRVNKISDYLADAETVIRDCGHKLTAHLGWVNREWVWAGRCDGPSYIGDPLPPAGDLVHWRRGLDHLLTLGEAGYPALVCLAASAGAPLVRLAGRRNPVIALASRTSTGKGSSVNYALSIWTDANLLTLPASSTVKGTQDRAMWLPDVALFADELHQLEDDDLHKLLYFLGNGQRRVTSTIHQKAVGGQRRYGVSFVAAEMELLAGRHGGVGTRVLEITASPLPDAQSASILQAATRHHGAAGIRLAAILTPGKASLLDDAGKAVSRRCDELHGDDLTALSVIWAGAWLLCEALEIDQRWVKPCMEWLIEQHTTGRAQHVDRVEMAWEAVIGTVGAGLVSEDLQLSFVAGEPIAWRNNLGTWDINPRHPRIVAICRENGGEYQLASSWADRGLIERGDGRNIKVRRRVGTELVRVFRQAAEAQE